MIVARHDGRLAVVLQVDHQEQCALAAMAWGNDTFARLDPWEPVVRAAALHDEGWRAWEAAPQVDAAGRPIDFPDLDRDVHAALYRQGIDLAAAEEPLVGLLVSMHGEGLYASRPGLAGPGRDEADLSASGRAFVVEQRARQQQTLGTLGDEWASWAADAYRLLQAWDALSLSLTWRGLAAGREGRLRAVPAGPGGPRIDIALHPLDERTARCAPWPFRDDEIVLPVRRRLIADRRYRDHGDLQQALASARDEEFAPRLVR